MIHGKMSLGFNKYQDKSSHNEKISIFREKLGESIFC